MFVTIIEFKLTSLAGFVLVPFALWNRTSFLAERVLGNVVGSGLKVMVLAVIVGIGSNYFESFTAALAGQEPDIGQAMSLMLAALSLFGLGIFGPTVAAGLISGGPQLGAGAAVGTMVGGASIAAAGAIGASGAARLATSGTLSAIRAGTTLGAAASSAYRLGQETSMTPSFTAGLSGVGSATASVARQKIGAALGVNEAAAAGRAAVWSAFSGNDAADPARSPNRSETSPGWAQALRRQQTARHYRHVAAHALSSGDHGGASVTPDISEKE